MVSICVNLVHNVDALYIPATNMGRIAITDGMSELGIAKLENLGYEVVVQRIENKLLLNGALSEFDAVIIRSATTLNEDVINASVENGGLLKVIGRAGVGVDNIDLTAATNSSIFVVNAPNASTQSVVELTIGHLLNCVRNISTGNSGMKNGLWEKKKLNGTELSGKSLGVIGFGRIARRVAEIAAFIGMKIHVYDPYVKIGNEMYIIHNSIDDLFKSCTHISIHCNLTPETKNMVNIERIRMMPQIGSDGIDCGAHLVNCARGGVVSETDVLSALAEGSLTSAGLDVFEIEPPNENLANKHPNFHATPHIAASTKEAQIRVGLQVVDAVHSALIGDIPKTLVNKEILKHQKSVND